MLHEISQEAASVISPETESNAIGAMQAPEQPPLEDGQAFVVPTAYLPKEMPSDPDEYKRVLADIYAQAGKIVEDRAHTRQTIAAREELDQLARVSAENKESLAKERFSGKSKLGFFSRFTDWMREG